MATITSLQNPRVKDTVRLRDRRHREKQGRILIDGARELRRAIESGLGVLEIYHCPALCTNHEAQLTLELLPRCGAELIEVSDAVFEKLAFGDRAEGVLGVAAMPARQLHDLKLGAVPLLAVLEGVEKPGNVGAVLRSADGAGFDALILADAKTDLYNPNAIRASLGTIFTMQVCAATSAATRAWLDARGIQVVAARVDGSVPYTTLDYRKPTAIALGSEAEGLTPAWSGAGIVAARLPMLGTADSLNVSATAAVLFYEARRQRNAT